MPSRKALDMAASMSVRFWGVRGSVPCPDAHAMRYGGNTACVEVRCGEHILVLDAGTGIRQLGNTLVNERRILEVDLFLSHCHIDHMVGLPFFAPLSLSGQTVSLWAGQLEPKITIEHVVRRFMSYPLFPVQIETFPANIKFRDFRPGDTLTPRPGITVRTAPLHHPGGATGYRIDYAGRNVAYLTDMEFPDGLIDPVILALAQNSDLVILDSTYTDDELPLHVGWGHASWQQGVKFANMANAKKLCLFHHDPDHDDAFMDAIAKAADAARPGTIVAYDGLQINM